MFSQNFQSSLSDNKYLKIQQEISKESLLAEESWVVWTQRIETIKVLCLKRLWEYRKWAELLVQVEKRKILQEMDGTAA